MSDTRPIATPAATLIVLRERPAGPPEILMVERSAAMAFAAGALVFPGGKVEEADRGATGGGDHDPDDAAARVAAIRETIEEAGVAIGVGPAPNVATIDEWRVALANGEPIAPLVAAAGARLDLAQLTPFARWRPGHKVARVFDTRFYLARFPPGAPPPRVDATENTRVFWSTAQDTLSAIARGEARAIFPTRCTLERLACHASIDEALADARRHPPTTITPWIEYDEGGDVLRIPEGLGYPRTIVPLAEALRD